MRRADRLFQIIQLLRRRRVVTAAELAAQLEVSERTIYRDVRDLCLSGTPIEGEAGVGYRLRAGYDLPPLMFNQEEIEALVLGARIVGAFGDDQLAGASKSVLSKVESVLPKHLRPLLESTALFAPRLPWRAEVSKTLELLRNAVSKRRKVRFGYMRADGEPSERVVRPLAAFFWGKVWTMTAWCELREGFRNFRVDRIASAELLDDTFSEEPGRTLADYLEQIEDYPDSAR